MNRFLIQSHGRLQEWVAEEKVYFNDEGLNCEFVVKHHNLVRRCADCGVRTGGNRAQPDIDMEPELYKHYFLRELPERYHGLVDVRMFGPGERLVFEAYPREAFERTRKWIESWNLFPPEQTGAGGYDGA
ncbi:MAG: hypothetical protein GEU77_14355 [Deltaproteobacteria bacterium]|nr:hypothetical protein [Deltaproteobacteria bacterium]